MQYIFETDYSFSARLVLNRALGRIAGGRRGLLIRLACLAGSAAVLACAGALVALQGFTVVVILPALLGCLVLLLSLFLNPVRAWLSGWLILRGNTRRREEFYADGFVLLGEGAPARLPYSHIWRVCETRDYFLLFLDERHAHIVSKRGAVRGDPSRFPAFIAEKTGVPVRKLNHL